MRKAKAEIATIDVALVTIEIGSEEIGFDTSDSVQVEPQIETTDAVKLILKGVLRAQKLQQDTLTGNTLTLRDNVFNPDLVLAIQGGTIKYDSTDTTKIVKYEPPVAGSADKGETFKLNAYSAVYDTAGILQKYEKTTYPNCVGTPISFNSEDGTFRASEYTIYSAPSDGEAPYTMTWPESLPEFTD